MYSIIFTKHALRVLRRAPKDVATLIQKKINEIANNPYGTNNNVTKLVGRPGYRLRVGNWRVIYELQDTNLVLIVIKIGPRGDVYQ